MQSFEKTQGPSSIKVTPYYALYTGDDDSYHYFDMNFSLLQSNIIKNSLQKVEIKIYNKNVTEDKEGNKTLSYSDENSNVVSSQNFIQKQLLKSYNLGKFAKKKKDTLIASTIVGSLEYSVFQAAKSEIKSGKDPQDIDALYYSVSTIEPLSDLELAVLKRFTSIDSKDDIQDLNLRILSNYRVDPAEAIFAPGYSRIDEVKRITKFYQSQKPKDAVDEVLYKKVFKKQFIDRINFTAKVAIPKKFANQNLDVNFEVYRSGNNVPFEIKKTQLEVGSFVAYENAIKKKPRLGHSENSKLLIFQEDELANAIQTYKKEINNIGDISGYSLMDDAQVFYRKQRVISALKHKDKIFVFRSVPYNSDSTKKANVFGSIVVGDPFEIDRTSLVLMDKPDNEACLLIKLYNIPSYASQVKIIRKQVVSGVVREDTKQTVVNYDYVKSVSSSVTLEDATVKSDEIYEYTVFYKTKTGEERRSKSQIYKYINSAISTTVSTFISTPSLSVFQGEPSFSFTVTSQLKKKEVNKILEHLKNVDIYEEFKGEMAKVNDAFGELIIHRVVRVNLKTGQREVFEDVPVEGGFVDDAQTRKKFSVSKLDPTASYQYEVRVSLRDPVTLLRDYVKTVTVPMGNGTKTYSYRPYRWRQPTTLKTGTLLAQDVEGNIISTTSLFEDGEIGVTATYLLADLTTVAVVDNLTAERLDVNKVKITWDAGEGIEEQFDHYVVSREVNGKKVLLGSSYSREYIDVIDLSEDVGTIFYQVTPVFMNYAVGSAIRSNPIFVDPTEYFTTYVTVA